MTVGQFWTITVKQWRLVLACVVVMVVGAWIGSKLMTPLYQATALVQVAVNSGNTDINNLLASDQLVQTEATLATSDTVLREVASHYQGITVDQLSKQVTAVPKLNTQLFEIDVLEADPKLAAELANDVARTLIKQQLQMTQQETAQANFLNLVQTAQPGSRPVQPNTLLDTAAGLAGGLFLGLLLAVLVEQLDTRARTPEVIAELLSWPLLGKLWLSKAEEVINSAGQHSNSEAYRLLRTNIGLISNQPLHSLVVTSAMRREGKSVIAANLAIIIAKSGKNTLLVDANLRHPVQERQFGLPANSPGLSNAVMACGMSANANSYSQQQLLSPLPPTGNLLPHTSFTLDPFIHRVSVPNLRVLPAGSLATNPSDVLDSKAMEQLFPYIEKCGAEVVIFDTPALLGLSDTSILAAKVDATLVVVDTTRANKNYLKQVKALAQQTGIRVIGCVVNKQKRNPKDAALAYSYPDEGQDGKGNQSSPNGHAAIPASPMTSMSPMQPGK